MPLVSHIPYSQTICYHSGPEHFLYQRIPKACWLPMMEMVPRFVPVRDHKKAATQLKM